MIITNQIIYDKVSSTSKQISEKEDLRPNWEIVAPETPLIAT